MEPILNTKPFEIFVTHVKKEHGFVKILGQIDVSTGQVVEKYLKAVREQLEGGNAPQIHNIDIGQVVIVSREGSWFRGKIVSVESSTSRVTVYFLDHGMTLQLPLSSIRTGVHSQLSQVQPLATPFLLGEVVPPGGDWSKPAIEFATDAIVGSHCRAIITHRARGHNFCRIFARDTRESLAQDMVQCGMAVSGLPQIDSLPPAQNYVQTSPPNIFPSSRAPPSPNYPPPLSVIVPPMPPPNIGTPHQFLSAPPMPRTTLFRPMHLETGKWYSVYLSSTEGGPADFCVQLDSLSKKLDDVMKAINCISLRQLPPPAIQAGVPCLARYTQDKTIYRAVVLKRDKMAKVYYLDFGNSEVLPLDSIYAIPPNQLATQMLSVRCSVYQWPDLDNSDKARARSKLETLADRVLQCRVVSAEGGSFASARTVVQLYEDGQDLGQEMRLWLARQEDDYQDWTDGGHQGQSSNKLIFANTSVEDGCDVYLSYTEPGGQCFYVNRADSSNALDILMGEVREVVQKTNLYPLNNPQIGTPCLARYNDGVWYRATVQGASDGQLSVYYVDYGNTGTVSSTGITTIPPTLVNRLPAQAVKCKLAGVGMMQLDMEKFRVLLSHKFRVRVDSIQGGVCLVHATTLPLPGRNINLELTRGADNRNNKHQFDKKSSSSPINNTDAGDTEELFITWIESSNSFYGQLTRLGSEELKEFLNLLSDHCHRHGELLYADGNQHRGDVCAVPNGSSDTTARYYRAIITRENRDYVDVNLLDIGGRDRVSKNDVYSLPGEFGRKQEWGVVCSLSCNPAVGDTRLRGIMMNSLIEVKMVKRVGDGVVVALTNNSHKKYKNNLILKHIQNMGGGQHLSENSKLNMLYEKQNNKQNCKIGDELHSNGKTFERGDLRNSLREKRAAREMHAKSSKGDRNRGSLASLANPNFKVGWKGSAKITWMYNPSHFYIQVQNEREVRQFESLMGNLQASMREKRENDISNFSKDQIVAAKWSDDCWYRGQVINARANKMEIFFVDFGNIEKVSQEDVCILPSEFGIMECQAVKVKLAGVNGNWDIMADQLAKYFNMDLYRVEITSGRDKDGAYLIRLNGGDIVKSMVKDKVAISIEDGVEMDKKLKRGKKENDTVFNEFDAKGENDSVVNGDIVLDNLGFHRKGGKCFLAGDFPPLSSSSYIGTTISGLVSRTISWKEFWIQPQPENAIEISRKINNENSENLLGKVVKSIEVGECCLALWNSEWHRATVMEKKEGGHVDVQFVDTGYSQTLPLSNIRDGCFDLFQTHPAAVKCRLDNKLDNFSNILESQNYKISAKVKSFKDNTFIVKLEREKKGKKKGKKDVAGSSGDIDSGIRVDVTVVHVERVNKLWVVLKDKLPDLQSMMCNLAVCMEGRETLLPSAELEVGSLCCVEYSEDGEVYRAKIVGLDESVAEVEYIDYGNSEEVDVSNILQLPSQFINIPPAAVSVRLRGAGFAMDTDQGRKKLEYALGSENVSLLLENGEGVFWEDGKKLDLVKLLRSNEDYVNMFQVSNSPRVECLISFAEADSVWLLSIDLQEGLDRLMERLQERAKGQGKVGKVNVNDLVIAKFSQDKNFYRARVVNILGSKTEVHYIDYGNKEVVDVGTLKVLPQELRLHPGFAMQAVVDSTGDCNMFGPGEVMDLIGQAKPVTAELVQPRGGIVRLFHAGRRIGFQPLAPVASLSLPSTRLRLGEEWLGLVTSSTSQGLSIQNIAAAAKVSENLSDFGECITHSEIGKVYIQVTEYGPKRVVVQKLGCDQTTLCSMDSQLMEIVPTSTMLFSCLPRQRSMPPAAITCAALTTKTRDRYQLVDKLMKVSVSNSNLKLEEIKWKFSPTFSHEEVSSLPLALSMSKQRKTSCYSFNLPFGNWDSNTLSNVRDMVLASGLKLVFHPGNIINFHPTLSLQQMMKDLNLSLEGFKENKPTPCCKELFYESFYSLDVEQNDIHSYVDDDQGKLVVKVHPNLPPLEIKCESSQHLVESVTDSQAFLRIYPEEEVCLPMPESLHSVSAGELCIYHDGVNFNRSVITHVLEDFLEVWLIDKGHSVLCDQSELSKFPENQLVKPPQVLSVILAKNISAVPGKFVNGKISLVKENLVLQTEN